MKCQNQHPHADRQDLGKSKETTHPKDNRGRERRKLIRREMQIARGC